MSGEYDFTAQKAYFIKFSLISMRLKAHYRTEMMGLIGAGNNPMVGMTVAVAVVKVSDIMRMCQTAEISR